MKRFKDYSPDQQLLDRAEAINTEEDALYGAGKRGDELPEELRFRQQRLERKLRTKKGRLAYAKRKQTVEPVFGQIKQAGGFRRFLLRA